MLLHTNPLILGPEKAAASDQSSVDGDSSQQQQQISQIVANFITDNNTSTTSAQFSGFDSEDPLMNGDRVNRNDDAQLDCDNKSSVALANNSTRCDNSASQDYVNGNMDECKSGCSSLETESMASQDNLPVNGGQERMAADDPLEDMSSVNGNLDGNDELNHNGHLVIGDDIALGSSCGQDTMTEEVHEFVAAKGSVDSDPADINDALLDAGSQANGLSDAVSNNSDEDPIHDSAAVVNGATEVVIRDAAGQADPELTPTHSGIDLDSHSDDDKNEKYCEADGDGSIVSDNRLEEALSDVSAPVSDPVGSPFELEPLSESVTDPESSKGGDLTVNGDAGPDSLPVMMDRPGLTTQTSLQYDPLYEVEMESRLEKSASETRLDSVPAASSTPAKPNHTHRVTFSSKNQVASEDTDGSLLVTFCPLDKKVKKVRRSEASSRETTRAKYLEGTSLSLPLQVYDLNVQEPAVDIIHRTDSSDSDSEEEGWDNPFQPEGEVSQDADKILQMWKYGGKIDMERIVAAETVDSPANTADPSIGDINQQTIVDCGDNAQPVPGSGDAGSPVHAANGQSAANMVVVTPVKHQVEAPHSNNMERRIAIIEKQKHKTLMKKLCSLM